MRLAYRRNGVLLRGRAGDDAIADPRGLLNRCADVYWKLDGVGKVDLYAALAVAEGWSGSALVERVAAAAGQDVADARPAITRCLRELETACGSTAEPITGDALRAFASLVLSR